MPVETGSHAPVSESAVVSSRESDAKVYRPWLLPGTEAWPMLPEDFDDPPPAMPFSVPTQVVYQGKDRIGVRFVRTRVNRFPQGEADAYYMPGQEVWIRNAVLTETTNSRRPKPRPKVARRLTPIVMTDPPAEIIQPTQAVMPGFEPAKTYWTEGL